MIPSTAYLYGIIASIIGAFGALFLKKGAKSISLQWPINFNIILGGFLYAAATIFFILGLKNSPLSFFYPLTSMLYLFAALLGFFVLSEKVNRYKILGICLVILGIILNSLGR